jgi:hypothetical protein
LAWQATAQRHGQRSVLLAPLLLAAPGSAQQATNSASCNKKLYNCIGAAAVSNAAGSVCSLAHLHRLGLLLLRLAAAQQAVVERSKYLQLADL